MSDHPRPSPWCWRVEEGLAPCPEIWPAHPPAWCPACQLEHGQLGSPPGWSQPAAGYQPVPFAAFDDSPGWHLHHFEPEPN